jgi:hypothetical protein
MKIIKEQVTRTGNTIGNVFKKDVTKASIAVREFFVNNQEKIEGWAKTVKKAIGDVVGKLKEYIGLAKAGNFEAIFKDIGNMFEGLFTALVNIFEKVKPFAISLGKEIAQGFFNAIEETKLGKSLKLIKKGIDITTLPIRTAAKVAGDVAAEIIVPDRARLQPQTRDQALDALGINALINQVKKTNEILLRENRI